MLSRWERMPEKGVTMKLRKVELLPSPFNWKIFVNNRWRAVIRYDSAHSFAHIDRYYLDGSRHKTELNLAFSEALALADEDIKENWNAYKTAFMKGK